MSAFYRFTAMVYSSTLKTEEVYSSETLMNLGELRAVTIQEDSTARNDRLENTEFNLIIFYLCEETGLGSQTVPDFSPCVVSPDTQFCAHRAIEMKLI